MKKFLIWLFIKSIVPKMKVVFTDEESSFEWSTDTIYLNLNENVDGFMRHLKKKHLSQYYQDNAAFSMRLSLYDINKTVWQTLHEIGHYFTLDFVEEDEDEQTERAICALIDKDVAENSEAIQDMYFNLEKEWQATEWAIRYTDTHYRKCMLISKLLDG